MACKYQINKSCGEYGCRLDPALRLRSDAWKAVCEDCTSCRTYWLRQLELTGYDASPGLRRNGSMGEIKAIVEDRIRGGATVAEETPPDEPDAALAEAEDTAPAPFDYSALDSDTALRLQTYADEIRDKTSSYATELGRVLSAAQELLADHYNGTFEKWYTALGFKRQTVYKLIQRNNFLVLHTCGEPVENLPLALSYEVSKPSAPPELVQKVMDGDITTHAEYKRLLAEKEDAERIAREAAAAQVEAAEAQAVERRERERLQSVIGNYRNAKEVALQNQRLREDDLQRMRVDRDQLAAKLREAEARPVDVAVAEPDPAEIDRRVREATAAMRKQLADLQRELQEANDELDNIQYSAPQAEAPRMVGSLSAAKQLVEGFRATAMTIPAALQIALTGLPFRETQSVYMDARYAADDAVVLFDQVMNAAKQLDLDPFTHID